MFISNLFEIFIGKIMINSYDTSNASFMCQHYETLKLTALQCLMPGLTTQNWCKICKNYFRNRLKELSFHYYRICIEKKPKLLR